MRIGCKVINAYPDSGYDPDKELNRKYLKPGKAYTIDKMIVHNWSTEMYLKEFPGISFNSVHFEFSPEIAPASRGKE